MVASTRNSQANEDFRLFLQKVLIERCKERPGYSLRAFARQLGIDPTAFSNMLSGKRRLTTKMMMRFADKLDLRPEEREQFRSRLEKGSGVKREGVEIPSYNQLSVDAFQAISTWYYYAILELTYVKGFQPDFKWIARKLGITPLEAKIAAETLQRLGLLKVKDDGTWADQVEYFTNIQYNFTNTAQRLFQKQILQKALSAIDEIPIEMRSQTSMTFAADQALINEAKEKIQHFMRSLTEFMQSGRQRGAVYQLSVSFFPLTKDTT